MDQFEKLKKIAHQQEQLADFPSWLLADVIEIVDNREQFADKSELIELLICQISDYDPYAGAGCFDTSVGVETIRSTIRQMAA